jgi:hypothetical protein
MRHHVDPVGVAFILYGMLQLALAGTVVLIFVAFSGALVAEGMSPGEEDLMVIGGFYGGVGAIAAVIAALMAVPNVVVGAGLRRRIRWAWFGGLGCAALALSSFPLGTILGVWALLTLLDRDVNAEFNQQPAG